MPACSLCVQVLGKSDARGSGAAQRAQHRLELRGAALPPWVLDRLVGLLAVTQVRQVACCVQLCCACLQGASCKH